MTLPPPYRTCTVAGLALMATFGACRAPLSAQPPSAPFTLDNALVYARQHSPRLSARRHGVVTRRSSVASARAERLPRLALGGAARGSSQPTENAMGFPMTQLADIPEGQAFRRGHLNADVRATMPLYTGGRIRSEVSLEEARRDLAQLTVRDVERGLDFDVTSTYANLVQLDRDIEAARESVKALMESRRVIARVCLRTIFSKKGFGDGRRHGADDRPHHHHFDPRQPRRCQARDAGRRAAGSGDLKG